MSLVVILYDLILIISITIFILIFFLVYIRVSIEVYFLTFFYIDEFAFSSVSISFGCDIRACVKNEKSNVMHLSYQVMRCKWNSGVSLLCLSFHIASRYEKRVLEPHSYDDDDIKNFGIV